jgi:F0F1-type ATP synthase membrane subunit b/b'
MEKIIELISVYPISFFLMVGILIAVIYTTIEEIKRKRNKNK